jgi:hypothetical protein
MKPLERKSRTGPNHHTIVIVIVSMDVALRLRRIRRMDKHGETPRHLEFSCARECQHREKIRKNRKTSTDFQ